jgi:integrase
MCFWERLGQICTAPAIAFFRMQSTPLRVSSSPRQLVNRSVVGAASRSRIHFLIASAVLVQSGTVRSFRSCKYLHERKERCTPIAKSTLAVLKAWLREPQRGDGDVLFPSARGERLTVHGVQYLLNKHRETASRVCPSLKQKRVTVHRLRHTMAMDLLQAGVRRSVIALWLGHESVETTQIYVEATLAMKEEALAKTSPPRGKQGRYRPADQLLDFLNSL